VTIAELVSILQKYPQDMTVYLLKAGGACRKLDENAVGYASIREADNAIEASKLRDFNGFAIVVSR